MRRHSKKLKEIEKTEFAANDIPEGNYNITVQPIMGEVMTYFGALDYVVTVATLSISLDGTEIHYPLGNLQWFSINDRDKD